jgi:DNA-directed RNA polymerase specialized sigma subunit
MARLKGLAPPPLDLGAEFADKPKRPGAVLAEPFTRQERRDCQRLYVENIGLVVHFKNQLSRKYRYCLDSESVDACVDQGFLKAFRRFDPAKGALSTILAIFAEGEVTHYLRDHNWGFNAPNQVRERGIKARVLMGALPAAEVAAKIGCTMAELNEALRATAGTAHEVMGFDFHASEHVTGWDELEREESLADLEARVLVAAT